MTRAGERDVREMLAAQDRPTIPVPLPDDISDEEARRSLRAAILGTWEPDSEPMPGPTPEDRLRLQDCLSGDYE